MPTNQEMIDITKELIASNKDLKKEIEDLSGRLSAKEILNRRTRMLTFASIGLAALCFIGMCASGYLVLANFKNIEINNQNAKINCENANSTREANRKIWTLVVQAANNNPQRTPKDIKNTEAFQDYINKLYMPRDCNDLDRRYPVPDPPEFEF